MTSPAWPRIKQLASDAWERPAAERAAFLAGACGGDDRLEHEVLSLVTKYPNLYVDTTMALAPAARRYVGADPAAITDEALIRYQDRILFGSDFPLIPYDYEEERRWAWDRALPDLVRRKIFHDNAARLLDRG